MALLNDKNNKYSILILGAKSRIAKSLALIYADNGYNLILAGRNIKKDLSSFIEEIKEGYNIQILIYELDILDFDSHQNFYYSIPCKPIGVISFIGLTGYQLQNESSIANKKLLINTNFLGVINMIDIIAEDFKRKKEGWIIAISSVAADRAKRNNYIYAASKSALNTYLEGKRISLLSYNVKIINIKLGLVDTQMVKNLKYPKIFISNPKWIAKKNIQYKKKCKTYFLYTFLLEIFNVYY